MKLKAEERMGARRAPTEVRSPLYEHETLERLRRSKQLIGWLRRSVARSERLVADAQDAMERSLELRARTVNDGDRRRSG
jgi:hypothetical protein